MLRRRFIMLIMDAYRWVSAKTRLLLEVGAALGSAPARILAAVRGIANEREAAMQTRPAQELTADTDIQAAVQAETVSADSTEITASRPVWASVKSALVAYNRAAAFYIKYIFTQHTAGALSADGATAESNTAQRTGKAGKAIRAAGMVTEAHNRFTNTHTANGTAANGKELIFEKLTAAEVTAAAVGADGAIVNIQALPIILHRAKLSFGWIYPVVIDGTLIIKQAYDPVQTGEILNIDSVAWASPVLTEDCLYIEQAYGETQNENGILEIERLIWSNPEAVDGCLYVEQAYSTAQTDNELEVI